MTAEAATLDPPKTEPGKGLAIIADLTPEIFTKEKAAEIVAHIRREVLAIDRDVSTKKGREAVASMAAKIARSKTAADNFGKELKAEYKAKVDAIDGIRRVFWDGLEALQKEFRQPLTEFEEAEKARIAGHETGIANIQAMATLVNRFNGDVTTEDIADRLIVAQAIDTSGFQEFTARAEAAKAETVATLESMLEDSRRRDAEREELERLRREAVEREAQAERERAEREQREREERAAEQARQEAEQAAAVERERIEREAREAEERAAKAEQDRQDAERRAKEAEERARQQAEEAVRLERQRIEDERRAEEEAQRRREEDRTHRAAVNNAAVAALTAAGLSYGDAKATITAIAKGDVPHVSIAY